MPGELELASRREDADDAPRGIVDKDRLRESELGGHREAALGVDRGAVEEDAERVAVRPRLVDEDAEDVELGHRGHYRTDPRSIGA